MNPTASKYLTAKFLAAAAALLFAVALTALRLLLPSSVAVAVATAAVCAALALLAFAFRSRFAPAATEGRTAHAFFSSVSALLLLTCLGVSVWSAYFAPIGERVVPVNGTVSLLSALFSLLAAAYFLIAALAPSLLENKAARLLWSMTPVLFCAFRILTDFIATGTMPLANGGGYHILGMIATMLFFLCSCKLIAERGKVFTYLACGMIAIVLNAAYSVPLIVSFFKGSASVEDALYGVLFLALSLYIAERLVSLAPASEPAPSEQPKQV